VSLRDIMAADAAALCGAASDFAESATYKPVGAATAASLSVVVGDSAPQLGGESMVTQDARCQAVVTTAALAAAIRAALGSARGPSLGDLLTREDGSAWAVDGFGSDVGGMTTLEIRRQTVGAIGRGYGGGR